MTANLGSNMGNRYTISTLTARQQGQIESYMEKIQEIWLKRYEISQRSGNEKQEVMHHLIEAVHHLKMALIEVNKEEEFSDEVLQL